MQIVIYILTAIAIIVFLGYSALAIHHARKFRYISKRTVNLTRFYIAMSSVLVLAIIITAFMVKM